MFSHWATAGQVEATINPNTDAPTHIICILPNTMRVNRLGDDIKALFH